MPFLYHRIIRFKDTDAAGVVYFASVLSICHEAYEASLQAAGIDLKSFFSDRHRAIPIVHASIDFFMPMFCGEPYIITVNPTLEKPSEFSITYQIYAGSDDKSNAIAQAQSRHVCIHPSERKRLALNTEMRAWLEQYGTDDA